jgi:hypothetical protein
VRAGKRVRFRFRAVTGRGAGAVPVRRATIRFAGRRAVTDRRGRAPIARRFARRGRFVARATRTGMRGGRTSVRVRPAIRRSAPRFAG